VVLRAASGGDVHARDRLFAHAADCPDCAALLGELARDNAETADTKAAERYRIDGLLGAGGMGTVYRAYDGRLERHVALKVMRRSRGPRGPAEALLAEARVMAKLAHPNVVRVFDSGVSDGRVFVAMELVRGGTLRAWLAARRRTPDEILAAFAQAARGLGAAHRAGIVHRDFKPENLLVEDDRVLVTDFGLARTTHEAAPGARAIGHDAVVSTTVAGTPSYMSPEQLRGEPLDARTDVFAFSVALWEALAGERPFGREPRALLPRITKGPTATPALSPRLASALARGLAFDRRDRPRSAEEVVSACRRALAPPPRRFLWFAGAVGGAVLPALAFSAALGGPRAHPVRARNAALHEPSRAALGAQHGPRARIPTSPSAFVSTIADAHGERAGAQLGPRGAPHATVMHAFGAMALPFGEDTPAVLLGGQGTFERCAPVACLGPRASGASTGDTHCHFHVAADGTVSHVRCQTFVGDTGEAACPAVAACFASVLPGHLPPPSAGAGECVVRGYFSRAPPAK